MNTLSYFEVFDNYSEDGLKPNAEQVIGRFFNDEHAKKFAFNKGNYGNPAQVRFVLMNIYDSVAEAELNEGFKSC